MSTGQSVMVTGRIVWVCRDLFQGNLQTIYGTNDPKINPKTGEQSREYGLGLAVMKEALQATGPGEAGHIWAAMHQEAQTIYPGGQIPPDFAMKYKDGDTAIDKKGVPYSQRTGYAGHLVFGMTTTLPIKFFKYDNQTGQNVMINEGIKCGDYVQVQVNIKAHPAINNGNPGLYLNPMAVQWAGFGEEIINAPSGDQIFGAAAPIMPPGASAMPVASANQLVPTPAPAGVPAPMAAPMPAAMPMQPAMAPAPVAAPAPHHAVLPAAMQPTAGMAAQPVAVAMPVAAPAPVMQPAPMPGGVAYPAAAPAPVAQPVAAPIPGMPGVGVRPV